MYTQFFDLKERPFGLSPDPRYFFGSRGHSRVLAYLRYGVQQGEGFVVITGEVGTGKTTLVRTLLDELAAESNLVVSQLVSTQVGRDDLLHLVASSYGLETEGLAKAHVLNRLQSFFAAENEAGRRVLLVVDEVQQLGFEALEELRMLSNFQAGARPMFQSFLVGQGEFRSTLRDPGLEQLRQRVIAAHHLEPMDEADTRAYVRHRLEVAGWAGDPELEQEIFPGVYQWSGGVPRRINTLFDRLLLVAATEESHRIDTALLQTAIAELAEEAGGPAPAAPVPASAPPAAAGPLEARVAELEARVARFEAIVDQAQGLLRALLAGTGDRRG